MRSKHNSRIWMALFNNIRAFLMWEWVSKDSDVSGGKACHILHDMYVSGGHIKTANVAHFQRKIQLSGISVYPDSWASQLFRIIGV